MAPVVRKVDNAIHRINHYPVDSAVCYVKTYPLAIYPLDSVIQRSNNRGHMVYCAFLVIFSRRLPTKSKMKKKRVFRERETLEQFCFNASWKLRTFSRKFSSR